MHGRLGFTESCRSGACWAVGKVELARGLWLAGGTAGAGLTHSVTLPLLPLPVPNSREPGSVHVVCTQVIVTACWSRSGGSEGPALRIWRLVFSVGVDKKAWPITHRSLVIEPSSIVLTLAVKPVRRPGCGEGKCKVHCRAQARSPGSSCSEDLNSLKASGEKASKDKVRKGSVGGMASSWTLF